MIPALVAAGAAAATVVAPAMASPAGHSLAARSGHSPASPFSHTARSGGSRGPASRANATRGPASRASATRRPASRASASPLTASAALIAAVGRRGTLAPAATGKAVKNCTYYAARAGWPDNGYYGGDLVTAAAICVAESAGNPNLIVCDTKAGAITGQGNYPHYTCPKGTYS
jgi:hypothetical protein